MNKLWLLALILVLVAVQVSAQGSSAATGGSKQAAPALTANQREAQKHFRVAQTAIKDGNLDVALDELQKASALDGQNSYIWYDLAVVQSKKNLDEDALNSLNKAQEFKLPQKLKDSADSLRTTLTYNIEKHTKAQQAPAEEPTTPSIEETLEYLNGRVNSSFVPKDQRYTPGKFSIDAGDKMLWWSRWKLTTEDWCTYDGAATYFGALVIDLDATAIVFDPKSGDVTINCGHNNCWQEWVSCADYGISREGFLQRYLKTDTKPNHSDLVSQYKGVVIPTNGDAELAANFQRAVRHLIKLVQALPQNRRTNANDPFAQ
jgi:tetratricopeptide (TPR) repeat protein